MGQPARLEGSRLGLCPWALVLRILQWHQDLVFCPQWRQQGLVFTKDWAAVLLFFFLLARQKKLPQQSQVLRSPPSLATLALNPSRASNPYRGAILAVPTYEAFVKFPKQNQAVQSHARQQANPKQELNLVVKSPVGQQANPDQQGQPLKACLPMKESQRF